MKLKKWMVYYLTITGKMFIITSHQGDSNYS